MTAAGRRAPGKFPVAGHTVAQIPASIAKKTLKYR
jgi:hypothetical protein